MASIQKELDKSKAIAMTPLPRLLIIHSRDEAFIREVRLVLGPSQYIIKSSADISFTIEQILSKKNAVLIIDTDSLSCDINDLRTVYRNLASGHAVILVGSRSRSEKLLDWIQKGVAFRFIFKPLTPGQFRLCIRSAEKKNRPVIKRPSTIKR